MKSMFQRDGTDRQAAPQPLRVEGIQAAPLTPEPDDRELAAQALLEVLSQEKRGRHRQPRETPNEAIRDSAYYHRLSERIRQAHYASRLRLTRFLAFAEWQLKQKNLPWYGVGSLALLEVELYKRIDVVEREGGDLKRRWQHCLADVTVRMMSAPEPPEKKASSSE